MWWKYIDFQENIDRRVTILSHYSYIIINWPACFSSSMWISFSSFSSSCFCWNRACGRKVIISYMFGLFPQFQRKSYDILYCTCSTLFLICRRKAMISNIFHLFLQFQFLNSSLLFNLPSFAILLVTPFSTTAFAAIHNYSYSISFPVLNFIEMLNNREIKFYTSGSI